MSRDSSRTHIHLHKSKHADLFEEFTSNLPVAAWASSAGAMPLHHPLHPSYALYHPTSTSTSHTAPQIPELNTLTSSAAAMAHPLLPSEEINVPANLLPPNPEDDDDVVPDQHAAFGIVAAMGRGAHRTFEERLKTGETWRDFGSLRDMVAGLDIEEGKLGSNIAGGAGTGAGAGGTMRRTNGTGGGEAPR